MIIKYVDPVTNNIRIGESKDMVVKNDQDTEYLSFYVSCGNMYVNIFSDETSIKEMIDEVFSNEKLDTTQYNDVSIGIEFNDNKEDDTFIDMLNDILCSLDDSDIDEDDIDIDINVCDTDDVQDTEDYYDQDDGDITYHDFM